MNQSDITNMALFCDFENVALGVRDAQYEKFDIGKVLERLLLKGSIVVKKAYCDWERYKAFKAAMHEASFELIEIPHVRQSGKNSADIRMVVDALDLCYTKSHVETFVIISGDSDFSPLVSKLRENNKVVIGVGVKNSTSDLLIANCDEFIFYDDLVREKKKRVARRPAAKSGSAEAAKPSEARPAPTGRRSSRAASAKNGRDGGAAVGDSTPELDAGNGGEATTPAAALPSDSTPQTDKPARRSRRRPVPAARAEEARSEEPAPAAPAEADGNGAGAADSTVVARSDEEKQQEALDLITETIDALMSERGADDKVWGSMVKQALKRRRPGFNESYYGFRSFNGLLQEAERRGTLKLERDDKSGGYIIRLTASDE